MIDLKDDLGEPFFKATKTGSKAGAGQVPAPCARGQGARTQRTTSL